MDRLGFVPFDVPEMHREAGVLMQIDFMFVRRDHPVLQRCQEAIDQLAYDVPVSKG